MMPSLKPPSLKPPSLKRQTGVGLVTAIFLLVVIAGLAAAMVSVFSAQQAGSALDVQGARAYQAARAGVEWGLFRQKNGAACDGTAASFALPAASMLGAFTVTVRCEATPGPGDDAATTVRRLTATACTPAPGGACPAAAASLDYVERVIEVQL